VESINVTIDETSGRELKEEENESVEQLYKEEAKDEEGFKKRKSHTTTSTSRLRQKFAKDM
jgi:hypothetical protein